MTELKLRHRLCFPFCNDLGNKKIYRALKGLDDQININWSLFRVKQFGDTRLGGMELPNSNIKIPGLYYIDLVHGEWGVDWSDKQIGVFLAPLEYLKSGSLFYDTKREVIINLPNELNEQPHLHKHSTFQFYYLKNILFTASCQYLDCKDGKIKIEIRISVSPSGTYFYWESGTIFFKWKVEVRQNLVIIIFKLGNFLLKLSESKIPKDSPVPELKMSEKSEEGYG